MLNLMFSQGAVFCKNKNEYQNKPTPCPPWGWRTVEYRERLFGVLRFYPILIAMYPAIDITVLSREENSCNNLSCTSGNWNWDSPLIFNFWDFFSMCKYFHECSLLISWAFRQQCCEVVTDMELFSVYSTLLFIILYKS